jgi:hypothetical protein
MSCSLCWQLMRASAWTAAQTGVEPADQACLGKIYQCGGNREIPRLRPTALDIAQAPPRVPLRISEIMPATAPQAARGRADAGEAMGCTQLLQRPILLRLLRRLTPPPPPPPPPPPHFLSNNMFLREENQAVANHADFVAGAFWPRRLIW